ncbi:c-type cytochrome [Piscinibacter koreensis]|uniref:C-type cytochrome n=1 Tax=Piscinibacter koreensis TaxID=2742824 RepID=A0A7Y6NP34_9BURK|nr:c-type cytochrome [Schlegelella koreensis]NUZ06758.1 c-type cytochrome [Schlegelella koreensis]
MMRWALAVLAAAALAGCYREQRLVESPAAGSAPAAGRQSALKPGAREPLQPATTPVPQASAYEYNAYAVSQGQRLFRWYNCSGCHGNGGGNMGPPLMDDEWLYGSAPGDIYTTIVQGRPNGMPSFGGRISSDQVWQIVAYVRSMSGQLRKDVAPSRADALSGGAGPENTRRTEKPKVVPEAPPEMKR